MATIRGSEPDDIIPGDWGASLDALKQEVWFSVSYFMDIPEIEGYQHKGLFNTAAGMLGVNLKQLIDEYLDNFLEEDDGDGLLPLACFFAEYAEKLKDKSGSLDLKEVAGTAEVTQPIETVTIDKELFKQLLQLVLNLPDLGSKLAAINVDTGSAATDEVLISLEPSEFLLRLGAALRACGQFKVMIIQ